MSKKHLENLLKNAFDFLENSIGQIYEQPKYSVINFCSAIELILKAKLLNEHWSLIVEGKPNLSKFEQGNFKSIDFKCLLHRIVEVTNENLPVDIEKSFHALADHRNKMIHFFHEAHTEDSDDEIKANIIAEQDKAWVLLKKLFEKWEDVFGEYKTTILKLNSLMENEKRKDYYKKKFEKIKFKIDEEKRKGFIFKTCNRCNYPTKKEKELTDYLFEYKCEVCASTEKVLKMYCTNCEYPMEIDFNVIDIECDTCHLKVNKEQIIDKIAPDQTDANNCGYCGSLESVVTHENYYICTECSHITEYIDICEYCNAYQIGGNLEDSYYTGCEACEGNRKYDYEE